MLLTAGPISVSPPNRPKAIACTIEVFPRVFYALKDTVTPVVVGVPVTLVFIPMNWFFMHTFGMGIRGLALATSFGFAGFARTASADAANVAGCLAALALFLKYEHRPAGPWVVGLWLVMAATLGRAKPPQRGGKHRRGRRAVAA